MFRFLLLVLNPFCWADLWRFLTEDEDDSLDLTDTPTSAGYAKAQAEETNAWEERMRKKGRKV
jgi:hypothetical protein